MRPVSASLCQPRGHGHLVRQDVDRVRHDDDDAGVVTKVTRDVAYAGHIPRRPVILINAARFESGMKLEYEFETNQLSLLP